MLAIHQRFMNSALQLAQRHLGRTWPNPSVGALVVKDGQIVGQGVTARGGRPHAETQAIAQAGALSQGACLYVTLEPCSHHGQTPPCAQAIIDAGIRTVIVACRDTNPLISGRGIALLRHAGIEVIESICAEGAREINRGFFSVMEKKRPLVSLKLAASLDGKIATATGQSKWVTGETARQYGHKLRSHYDAIATGIGTVLADDPMLTCRLPGLEDTSPVRVVLDSHQRLPATSQLVQTAKEVPVWVISQQESMANNLSAAGVTLLTVSVKNGHLDLHEALVTLAEKGITRLLVEAGSALSTSFLQSGLVDRVYWFRAPLVVGNDGIAAINAHNSLPLEHIKRFSLADTQRLGPDTLDIYNCNI